MPLSPRPPIGITSADRLVAPLHIDHLAVTAWQAHVDAGRIGANPPTSPAVAEQLEANDALFRRIARDRRHLTR